MRPNQSLFIRFSFRMPFFYSISLNNSKKRVYLRDLTSLHCPSPNIYFLLSFLIFNTIFWFSESQNIRVDGYRFRDDCKSARKSHIPRSRRPWRCTSLVLSFVQPTNELIIQKGTRYWFPCSENLQTGDLRHIAGDWLLDYWSYRQLVRWLPI